MKPGVKAAMLAERDARGWTGRCHVCEQPWQRHPQLHTDEQCAAYVARFAPYQGLLDINADRHPNG